MGRRIRTTDGFTLVELIVVITMMAILAALAMPRYAQSVNHFGASASAQKLASDIVYAQARARATSTTRVISFNTATSIYQLPGEPDVLVPANTYTVNLTSAPFASTISAFNFNTAGTISFNAYGIPSSAGSIVLQSGSATATVTLDPLTGIVTIQ